MIEALLVDDEYFVRKGLISTMPWAEYGMRIVGEAANGVKALEFMREHPIHLLITDLSMPVMNGFELMREVGEEFPHVYRVVLSCHEDFKYIQDALRLGAIDYIVKTELEQGSMRESLQRISERVRELDNGGNREKEPRSKLKEIWSEAEEKKLQDHIRQWLPLYWVIRDDELAGLTAQLKSLNPPIAKLQKVMHYLLVEWNRTLKADFLPRLLSRVEELGSWAAWDAWIADLRGRMRGHLNVASYPDDVVERILQAAEQMKNRTDVKVTQSDLARQLNMNRGYFSKCFKDVIGQTFHDFIKEQRIAMAERLLLQSAKPISAIAEECGFLDHRYFSRQFREVTGKLPSEYRGGQV